MFSISTRRYDTADVVKRVKKLLKGHEDLLDGFNCFLPDVSHSSLSLSLSLSLLFFFSFPRLEFSSLLLGVGVLFFVFVVGSRGKV
jgi:hypothetical protein